MEMSFAEFRKAEGEKGIAVEQVAVDALAAFSARIIEFRAGGAENPGSFNDFLEEHPEPIVAEAETTPFDRYTQFIAS